jgi:hypothetical protein
MSGTKLAERDQLGEVERRLARSFGEGATAEDVHQSVERAYATFAAAPIRTYIPILVARMAAVDLRATGHVRTS